MVRFGVVNEPRDGGYSKQLELFFLGIFDPQDVRWRGLGVRHRGDGSPLLWTLRAADFQRQWAFGNFDGEFHLVGADPGAGD